jgi:hypothetical protein
MANTTKSISREFVDAYPLMPMYFYPTQATQTTLKAGAGATLDTSGRAGQFAAGERLIGLLATEVEFKDRSEATAAQTGKDIPVIVNPCVRIAISGAAACDEGKAVFMSDDQTFTFVPTKGTYFGQLVHYDVRNSLCTVRCDPGNSVWQTWVSLADNEEIALPAQAGVVVVATDAEFGIVHIQADGSITSDPHSITTTVTGDAIVGMMAIPKAAAPTTSAGCTQLDISSGATATAQDLVQPDAPRNVHMVVTDADTSISAGTVTFTGKDQNGEDAVESFDLTDGLNQVGSIAFASLTSVALSALDDNDTGDVFDFGYGSKFGVPGNGTSLSIVHLSVDGARDVVAATDTTNNTFTPTTAPNGAKPVVATYKMTPAYVGASTVTSINGSANFATTDSDSDLCVYDAGTNASLKNRLGSTKVVQVRFIGLNV